MLMSITKGKCKGKQKGGLFMMTLNKGNVQENEKVGQIKSAKARLRKREAVSNVPIKKRRFNLPSSSSSEDETQETFENRNSQCGGAKFDLVPCKKKKRTKTYTVLNRFIGNADFSGIEILAAVACLNYKDKPAEDVVKNSLQQHPLLDVVKLMSTKDEEQEIISPSAQLSQFQEVQNSSGSQNKQADQPKKQVDPDIISTGLPEAHEANLASARYSEFCMLKKTGEEDISNCQGNGPNKQSDQPKKQGYPDVISASLPEAHEAKLANARNSEFGMLKKTGEEDMSNCQGNRFSQNFQTSYPQGNNFSYSSPSSEQNPGGEIESSGILFLNKHEVSNPAEGFNSEGPKANPEPCDIQQFKQVGEITIHTGVEQEIDNSSIENVNNVNNLDGCTEIENALGSHDSTLQTNTAINIDSVVIGSRKEDISVNYISDASNDVRHSTTDILNKDLPVDQAVSYDVNASTNIVIEGASRVDFSSGLDHGIGFNRKLQISKDNSNGKEMSHILEMPKQIPDSCSLGKTTIVDNDANDTQDISDSDPQLHSSTEVIEENARSNSVTCNEIMQKEGKDKYPDESRLNYVDNKPTFDQCIWECDKVKELDTGSASQNLTTENAKVFEMNCSDVFQIQADAKESESDCGEASQVGRCENSPPDHIGILSSTNAGYQQIENNGSQILPECVITEEKEVGSHRERRSGWDQLPEGFSSAEEAHKFIRESSTRGNLDGVSEESAQRYSSIKRELITPRQSGSGGDDPSFDTNGGELCRTMDEDCFESSNFVTESGNGRALSKDRQEQTSHRGRRDYGVNYRDKYWGARIRLSPDNRNDSNEYHYPNSRNFTGFPTNKIASNGFRVTVDGTIRRTFRDRHQLETAGLHSEHMRAGRDFSFKRANGEYEKQRHFGPRRETNVDSYNGMGARFQSSRRQGQPYRYRQQYFEDGSLDHLVSESRDRAIKSLGYTSERTDRSFSTSRNPLNYRPRTHARGYSRSRSPSPGFSHSPRSGVFNEVVRRPGNRIYRRSPTDSSRQKEDMFRLSPANRRVSSKHGIGYASSANYSHPYAGRWYNDRRDERRTRGHDYQRQYFSQNNTNQQYSPWPTKRSQCPDSPTQSRNWHRSRSPVTFRQSEVDPAFRQSEVDPAFKQSEVDPACKEKCENEEEYKWGDTYGGLADNSDMDCTNSDATEVKTLNFESDETAILSSIKTENGYLQSSEKIETAMLPTIKMDNGFFQSSEKIETAMLTSMKKENDFLQSSEKIATECGEEG